MLFSIITVVRNDLAGLERTRNSLLAQADRRFEWLAVDGGSTDGSAEYLSRHRSELAWWRSQPDRGPYDGMNAGLERAQGDYLLFLNAGDELAAPETLAALAARLDAAHRPDFAYGSSFERLEDGSLVGKPARSHRHAWYGMFTHHQAMLYRRTAIGNLRYPLEHPIGADYAFTLETLKQAGAVLRLKMPVCVFAAAGLSVRRAADGRLDQFRIRRQALGLPWIANAGITGLQLASFGLRSVAPRLYRRLRFRN